jgi:hypothetical protein
LLKTVEAGRKKCLETPSRTAFASQRVPGMMQGPVGAPCRTTLASPSVQNGSRPQDSDARRLNTCDSRDRPPLLGYQQYENKRAPMQRWIAASMRNHRFASRSHPVPKDTMPLSQAPGHLGKLLGRTHPMIACPRLCRAKTPRGLRYAALVGIEGIQRPRRPNGLWPLLLRAPFPISSYGMIDRGDCGHACSTGRRR